MLVVKVLLVILKNSLLLLLIILVVGRLFFPQPLEITVIEPVKKLPLFGQVLGSTWDAAGNIGPEVTKKTVEFADRIEKSDLPINETVLGLAVGGNPQQAASEVVEQSVNETITEINNLPAAQLEAIKQEIRKEMYRQICQSWLGEQPIASSSSQGQ